MDTDPIRVLIADDNEYDFVLIREMLSEIRAHRYEAMWCSRGADLAAGIAAGADVCLMDYRFGLDDGIALIRTSIALGAHVPFVLITGDYNPDIDIAAMRAGARDFLPKSELSSALLEHSIRYAINQESLDRERLNAISELAESEARFKAAALDWQSTFDALGDAVWLLDRQHRIVRCNRASTVTFGKTPEDLIGRRCWEVVHGTSAPIDGCPVVRAAQTRRRETMELAIGERVFFITADPVFDRDGAYRGAVHVATDISERVRLEKALRVSTEERIFREKILQRTERLASLGQISGAIAHEINQPLQSIKVIAGTAIYLFEQEKRTLPYDKVIGEFRKINERVDRLDTIIRNMRVMLKSPEKVEAKELDLNEFILHTLDLFRQKMNAHGISFSEELSPTAGRILFSEVQLSQVVVNLIDNAIAAFDMVSRDERLLSVRTYERDGHVYFEVSDNGPGVADEHKERIFDPFYSVQQKENSMGLGLYIVSTILRSFDAAITVTDNELGGATFAVRFERRGAAS
ncbi:MAG: ATP-binding protein [Spirochaetota bacterium]